jgi:DNA-binding transcriptional LysR family regulator
MDRVSTLRLFARIVETGTISGGGRLLGLSTTTASKRLQDLEDSLGVRLLNRTTRNVSPTEAGQALFEQASRIIDELDATFDRVRNLQDQPAGLLRVVARRSFAYAQVLPSLMSFRAAYPLVEVDLTLTETPDLIPTHGADVVIRLGEPAEKSFTSRRLASADHILCASPDYLRRIGGFEDPMDLEHLDCLAYRREPVPVKWIAERGSERTEIMIHGSIYANSGEALRRAAVQGLGITMQPDWLLADDLAAGRLVRCLVDHVCYPARYVEPIYAVHARGDLVPAKVVVFVDHLEKWMRDQAL